MVKLVAEYAPAKINLCLRITGKRTDGYHELDSIFLPISWTDLVRLEVRPSRAARVHLNCDDRAISDPESNLASRAAAAFMREHAIAADVSIDLRKRIPMGAGLGGGSSDAGAVLRMMAEIFAIGPDARLGEVAVKLGADVPFFLDPRPARVRGIGEKIEALPSMPRVHLVVAVPDVAVPTASIFRALKREHWSGPLPDSDRSAILAGRISADQTVNDLEAAAIDLYPAIAGVKQVLEEEGATAVAMSGSGGSVFGLYPDAAAAREAAGRIRARMGSGRVEAVFTTSHQELRRTPLVD